MMNRTIEAYNESTQKIIQVLNKKSQQTIVKYSKENKVYIPNISFICFAVIDELGIYNPENLKIAISETLLNVNKPKEFLFSVLLHEIAHHICGFVFKKYDHGIQFKSVCKAIGAPGEFSFSKVDLKKLETDKKRIEKIKKLLALGESPNPHEAHSALIKAREIMGNSIINYNFNNEIIYTAALITAKRILINYRVPAVISSIISGVFLIHEKDKNSYMIFGSYSQVQVACYIFDFLNYELNKEYLKYKENKKGRLIESFYIGAYNELINKFNINKKEENKINKALEIVNKQNQKYAHDFYFSNKVFIRKKTGTRFLKNDEAFLQGEKTGKKIKIYKSIEKNKKEIKLINS